MRKVAIFFLAALIATTEAAVVIVSTPGGGGGGDHAHFNYIVSAPFNSTLEWSYTMRDSTQADELRRGSSPPYSTVVEYDATEDAIKWNDITQSIDTKTQFKLPISSAHTPTNMNVTTGEVFFYAETKWSSEVGTKANIDANYDQKFWQIRGMERCISGGSDRGHEFQISYNEGGNGNVGQHQVRLYNGSIDTFTLLDDHPSELDADFTGAVSEWVYIWVHYDIDTGKITYWAASESQPTPVKILDDRTVSTTCKRVDGWYWEINSSSSAGVTFDVWGRNTVMLSDLTLAEAQQIVDNF